MECEKMAQLEGPPLDQRAQEPSLHVDGICADVSTIAPTVPRDIDAVWRSSRLAPILRVVTYYARSWRLLHAGHVMVGVVATTFLMRFPSAGMPEQMALDTKRSLVASEPRLVLDPFIGNVRIALGPQRSGARQREAERRGRGDKI